MTKACMFKEGVNTLGKYVYYTCRKMERRPKELPYRLQMQYFPGTALQCGFYNSRLIPLESESYCTTQV